MFFIFNMATYTSSSFLSLSPAFYLQLVLVVCSTLAIRLAVSTWGHSGEGKPPMFGDFEAQRHWMEITTNLPSNQWYVDTPENDLQYWGLDYPPLTAYHMMINGKIAEKVVPDLVSLNSSRGIENANVKVFMRLSVLVMDLLIFIPAAVGFFVFEQNQHQVEENNLLVNIAVLVAYPGLILIDNGHFQYNNVSLGFLILATMALTMTFDLVGAVLFCLALNYKQMELYHATPFFFYLLGLCWKQGTGRGIHKLMSLGLVVIISFVAIWSPFLTSKDSALAVLQRIFPVNRGLYEDKVANFWCSLSVVIKFKQLLPHNAMVLICLITTVLGILPSSLHLLKNPTIKNFHYTTMTTSLVFFLFSFHVHEKSILLAAVPASFLINSDPMAVVWLHFISTFSMLPLFIKDGLVVPTISLCALYWMFTNHFIRPTANKKPEFKYLYHCSIVGAVCLGIATLTISPPSRYPDLFPLLISIFSCAHFIAFAAYFYLRQIQYYYSFDIQTKITRVHFEDKTIKKTVRIDQKRNMTREISVRKRK